MYLPDTTNLTQCITLCYRMFSKFALCREKNVSSVREYVTKLISSVNLVNFYQCYTERKFYNIVPTKIYFNKLYVNNILKSLERVDRCHFYDLNILHMFWVLLEYTLYEYLITDHINRVYFVWNLTDTSLLTIMSYSLTKVNSFSLYQP